MEIKIPIYHITYGSPLDLQYMVLVWCLFTNITIIHCMQSRRQDTHANITLYILVTFLNNFYKILHISINIHENITLGKLLIIAQCLKYSLINMHSVIWWFLYKFEYINLIFLRNCQYFHTIKTVSIYTLNTGARPGRTDPTLCVSYKGKIFYGLWGYSLFHGFCISHILVGLPLLNFYRSFSKKRPKNLNKNYNMQSILNTSTIGYYFNTNIPSVMGYITYGSPLDLQYMVLV
jgi:hypothetical protein